jgi:predicted RNase H-like nuclease (RuvC/YqgF family)
MISFLSIPAVLVAIGTIIGGVIIGFFYFIGLFGSTKRTFTKEAEEANKYVIESFKQKMEVLESRVTELDQKVTALQIENKSLRDVLQGKDEQTKNFQEKGFIAFQQLENTLAISSVNHEDIEKLYKLIERLIQNIEKKG